jgi:hypothetical protein
MDPVPFPNSLILQHHVAIDQSPLPLRILEVKGSFVDYKTANPQQECSLFSSVPANKYFKIGYDHVQQQVVT